MRSSKYIEFPVVCLTYRKVYDSIRYASRLTRTNEHNISKCCRGIIPHTINLEKTKLEWMFVEDYKKMYGESAYWDLFRCTQDFYTKDWMED